MARNLKDLGKRSEWKEGSIEQELYNKVVGKGLVFHKHGNEYVCLDAGIMYHDD